MFKFQQVQKQNKNKAKKKSFKMDFFFKIQQIFNIYVVERSKGCYWC